MQSLDGQFETHNNYKFVVRLEKAFAEKIGTKHSVGFVNGTATLHTALEPAIRNKTFLGRERLFEGYTYEKGLCPVAEMIQPQLLQFKTNDFDPDEAEAQAEILRKTIAYFGK